MALTEISQRKEAGDIKGLITLLESEDEYVRERTVHTLCTFCDRQVEETLSILKFTDPSLRVRQAASRGHEMVVAGLKAKGKI